MASPARPANSNHLLGEIGNALLLDNTGLAALFGVRRQAIAQWRTRGIPPARQEKAAALAAIAELLDHRLKPERIPGIARRPAPAYGGLTMLEMIAADRHLELLDSIRASFDFASAA